MGRSSPQSFEKRQRERRKQLKREEKFEQRLIRNEEKRLAKERGEDMEQFVNPEDLDHGLDDEPTPPRRNQDGD